VLGLCAGSGFEGTMARYRAHIEMVEEGIFHGISEDHFCSFAGGYSFQPFFFRMVIAGMRRKANDRFSFIVSIPFEKAQVPGVVAQDIAVHGTGVVRQFN